ncbi:MAG TPA: glycosyltransferase family 39 protein [Isosphaeraceae bacterium]|jgi:4-amino-4-deoxy-L-arabinose transferase-like glycosyltransferase|nr:glycosyltransferase family 39 protein [Isosphaeraceae bacterium]
MLGIGLIGLALRVVAAWQFGGHPLGRMAWIDEEAYWERGREILGGRWLPDRPFYQDPLYPYLLAAIMAAVGTGLPALRLALATLGSITPLLILRAGRRGLGKAEGVVAATLAALYGPFVFTDMLLEKEGLGALVAALALALTADVAARPRAAWPAVLAGLSWGALALLRSNALLVGPLGVIWCLAIGSRRPALGFAAGFALALAPVVAINAHLSKPPELIVTTWQAGANFYIGNGPEATGLINAPEFVVAHPFREADDYAAEAERRAGRHLSYGEVSRFWMVEGLKRWRDAPGASMRLLGKKFVLLLNDFEIGDNHNIDLTRLVAAPAIDLASVRFGWLLPLAAIGLARPKARRSAFWWFLVLSTAAGLASTAAFFVVGRYRIPWVPGLALLAAGGIADLAWLVRERRRRGLVARVLLLGLPAAVLAWRPTPIPAEERWAFAERRLVVASLQAGDLDAAIDALDDGRALGPEPMRRFNEMLAGSQEAAELAESIRSRLALRERFGGTPPLLRARWLRVLPSARAEARRLLDDALAADPLDPRARTELGAWWLGSSDPSARDHAAAELRRAAATDPAAAILLALLFRDRSILDAPGLGRPVAKGVRMRVARAIVREEGFTTKAQRAQRKNH